MSSHDPYAALRYRDFILYLGGHLFAILGAQMQAVAIGWELYERTASAWALGLVGLVQFLPVILLAIPVGHFADAYSRRSMLLVGQSIMGLASAGLAYLSFTHGPLWMIYACLLLTGISNSIVMVTRGAFVSALVPKQIISNAITWSSSSRQVATMIGPALGGLLIAWTGSALLPYVCDAAFAGVFAALILTVRSREQARKKNPVSIRSLLAGVRFIGQTKLILSTITLDMMAVLFGGAITLLPMFAKDILHVGPDGLGWLRAAPPIGAMVMAISLAHLPILKRAGPAMLWAVAGFGVAGIIFGLSQNFALSMIALALTGAFDTVGVIIRQSLVQLLTPDTMLGRVGAVNSVFISSSNELGGFESGVTAALMGPVLSVVLGGIGTILSVMFVAWKWPEIRKLRSLHTLRPIEESPEGSRLVA